MAVLSHQGPDLKRRTPRETKPVRTGDAGGNTSRALRVFFVDLRGFIYCRTSSVS